MLIVLEAGVDDADGVIVDDDGGGDAEGVAAGDDDEGVCAIAVLASMAVAIKLTATCLPNMEISFVEY